MKQTSATPDAHQLTVVHHEADIDTAATSTVESVLMT